MNNVSYEKEYSKGLYDWCKSHKVCPNCYEPAVPGRVYCATHAGDQALYQATRRSKMTEAEYRAFLDQNNETHRRLYAERKAAGTCVQCGKPVYRNHTRCYEHYIHNRNYMREYKRKIRFARIDTCRFCDSAPLPGQKMCQKHYDLSCEALKKARAVSQSRPNAFVMGVQRYWVAKESEKVAAEC